MFRCLLVFTALSNIPFVNGIYQNEKIVPKKKKKKCYIKFEFLFIDIFILRYLYSDVILYFDLNIMLIM